MTNDEFTRLWAALDAITAQVRHMRTILTQASQAAQRPQQQTLPLVLEPCEPTPTFDEFWTAYPRRVGKGTARTAWKRAVQKAPPAAILAAVRATRWPDDPRFIPHPATWLNQERWLDHPNHAAPNTPANPTMRALLTFTGREP